MPFSPESDVRLDGVAADDRESLEAEREFTACPQRGLMIISFGK